MIKTFIFLFLILIYGLSAGPHKLFKEEIQFDVEGKFSGPEKIGEESYRLFSGDKSNPNIELIFKKFDKKFKSLLLLIHGLIRHISSYG